MKKAGEVKLERQIATKATELAKLMRRRADANEGGNHNLFQVDGLPGGVVVIQAQALSAENTRAVCGACGGDVK